MIIREYRSADCAEMAKLFYDTVHSVCTEYTEEQRAAWADGSPDLEKWDESFREHHTLIAEEDGVIVGFADMDEDGYLDRLYIHRDHQRQGIAAALCSLLESACPAESFCTCASLTAKGFFEKRGWTAVFEQQVQRHGVSLTNFRMEKDPLQQRPAGKIITVCGSYRFWDQIQRISEQLALEGNVVLGMTPHVLDRPLTEEEKSLLGELHLKKIDLSDAVYAVNPGGYMGESLRREVGYARERGKEILWLEKPAQDA